MLVSVASNLLVEESCIVSLFGTDKCCLGKHCTHVQLRGEAQAWRIHEPLATVLKRMEEYKTKIAFQKV